MHEGDGLLYDRVSHLRPIETEYSIYLGTRTGSDVVDTFISRTFHVQRSINLQCGWPPIYAAVNERP